MYIRQQELAVRGKGMDMEEAIAWIKKHARKLDDLRFALAPQRLSGVMLEAAQYPACQDYEKAAAGMSAVALEPTLILFHADDDRNKIVGLNFAGSKKESSWLNEILNKPEYVTDFEMWLGGGQYGCFFGAKARVNHPGPAINDLVSRLLENLLITGRPLRYYNCTFHLPLDLMFDNEIGQGKCKFDRVSEFFADHHVLELGEIPPNNDVEKNAEAQSYHYFLPNLRKFIFETNGGNECIKPIQHWRLKGVNNMGLAIARKDQEEIVANFREVALYRYFNGLYCLAIQVNLLPLEKLPLENSSLNVDETGWWRDLFYNSDEQFKIIQRSQIAEWLRFTKLVRLLYHSFPEQESEKKIAVVTLIRGQGERISFDKTSMRLPQHIGEEVSCVVLDMLSRFFSKSESDITDVRESLKYRLDNIPDDRMYVNVAYALTGTAPRSGDTNAWNQHERLFSLAMFVDEPNDGWKNLNSWAYDEGFTRQKMHELSLNRWKGLGTRSGYTEYSNAHLGYGGFFSNPIAITHVPYIYGRMLLIALFYQASLRHYQRWVTLATDELIGNKISLGNVSLSKARRNFIEFTNNYWFRDITSQMQGREIFAKQVAALELTVEYDLIKDEMERADEFVEMKFQTAMNDKMGRASTIGLLLALASLFYAGAQIDAKSGWLWSGSALLTGIVFAGLGWILWGCWNQRRRD